MPTFELSRTVWYHIRCRQSAIRCTTNKASRRRYYCLDNCCLQFKYSIIWFLLDWAAADAYTIMYFCISLCLSHVDTFISYFVHTLFHLCWCAIFAYLALHLSSGSCYVLLCNIYRNISSPKASEPVAQFRSCISSVHNSFIAELLMLLVVVICVVTGLDCLASYYLKQNSFARQQ